MTMKIKKMKNTNQVQANKILSIKLSKYLLSFQLSQLNSYFFTSPPVHPGTIASQD